MKKTIFLLLLIWLSNSVLAQKLNTVILDTNIDKEILIGYCNKIAFENNLFKEWFSDEYNAYVIDTVTLDKLSNDFLMNLKITTVFGTWCPDSRREVPRFYKILDYLNFNNSNFTLIAVDRKKKADNISTDKLNIQLVPTFIFYYNDKEIGRIIESPSKSLEKDILKIFERVK